MQQYEQTNAAAYLGKGKSGKYAKQLVGRRRKQSELLNPQRQTELQISPHATETEEWEKKKYKEPFIKTTDQRFGLESTTHKNSIQCVTYSILYSKPKAHSNQ